MGAKQFVGQVILKRLQYFYEIPEHPLHSEQTG